MYTFASQFRNECNRNVAQLVAHYVRDVGVGRSSRLIPTEQKEVIEFSMTSFLFIRYPSFIVAEGNLRVIVHSFCIGYFQ